MVTKVTDEEPDQGYVGRTKTTTKKPIEAKHNLSYTSQSTAAHLSLPGANWISLLFITLGHHILVWF